MKPQGNAQRTHRRKYGPNSSKDFVVGKADQLARFEREEVYGRVANRDAGVPCARCTHTWLRNRVSRCGQTWRYLCCAALEKTPNV